MQFIVKVRILIILVADGSACWNITKASGINANGIITGTGTASYAVDSFPTFALMLNKLRAYI